METSRSECPDRKGQSTENRTFRYKRGVLLEVYVQTETHIPIGRRVAWFALAQTWFSDLDVSRDAQ